MESLDKKYKAHIILELSKQINGKEIGNNPKSALDKSYETPIIENAQLIRYVFAFRGKTVTSE
jgi:hypothetical protein